MRKILTTLAALCVAGGTSFAQDYSGFQYFIPNNKQGLNRFETTKADSGRFEGVKIKLGGAFAQDFQGLTHSNTADSVPSTDGKTNINRLKDIGNGFNNASANALMDVQLADGIRLNLTVYLSSRHHQETWVKGGYLQFDKIPLGISAIDDIMKYLTLKVGHMEINYGDAHFRRTDGGNALFNPFVENYIMDAFTTEIGAELYFKYSGLLAMLGATGGEIKGDVTSPNTRNPAYQAKLGWDGWINKDLRLRLTGSMYTTNGSISNTLYGGDRTGSHYFWVLENTTASTTANAFSGRVNPGFGNKVTAFVVNPFIKFMGLEFFGNFEQAKGRALGETADRSWSQIGADLLFRFGPKDDFYVAGRYNTVTGQLRGAAADQPDVTINRIVGSLGWFLTDNILAKLEYVTQKYNDYPAKNILNGGEFHGFMLQGAVNF